MNVQFLSDIFGLIGVLALAWPAVHVCRYALKAAYLSEMRKNLDPKLRDQLAVTIGNLHKIRDSWSKPKAVCLIGGTICAGLSYALPILENF